MYKASCKTSAASKSETPGLDAAEVLQDALYTYFTDHPDAMGVHGNASELESLFGWGDTNELLAGLNFLARCVDCKDVYPLNEHSLPALTKWVINRDIIKLEL